MGSGDHLRDHLKNLPEQPGVYQFLDANDRILYIGKAKNLKKRVSSYFLKKGHDSFKVTLLVSKIRDLRTIVVNSESDALLLENNLIKKHQPRYNILLKDDKTFPWICIKSEPFPRIFTTRQVIRDGSEYYGPYTSAYAVKVLLSLIRQIYPLRNCKHRLTADNIAAGKFKVCLEYHLGNCMAPCVGLQELQEYEASIDQIRNIIKGKLNEVIDFLKQEMTVHAKAFRFEEANRFKEKIDVLARYQAKSTIVNPAIHDVDVYSIVSDEKEAYVNFLKVVKGAVIQAHSVELKKRLDESEEELLAFAINDLRIRQGGGAREWIVSHALNEEFPNQKMTVPQRGDKKKLLDLSLRNARTYRLERRKQKSQLNPGGGFLRVLETMQKDLRLKQLPMHIECFDNSNFQGSFPVAACVVFKGAKPAKKEYRHFNIKTVEGIDDFASMEEVVYRRYRRLQEENLSLPQLIIVDGGKGQLNAAVRSLDRLELRHKIAIVGIAKRLEEIYFPGDAVPLYIDKNSESLKLIQQLRNEAHRFGITFHRQKRSKDQVMSRFMEIPGIGQKTVEHLFQTFKSLEGIRTATDSELKNILGEKKAVLVRTYLDQEPQ
ncbi:MAG: excinuclease ABC subunit UvrC [Bacteroidales bacterium]